MKKFMVILGIAFALIVGVFAIANKPVDAEAINAESYEMTCDEVENRYGDDVVYVIKPHVTRDDIVTVYRVIVFDGATVDEYNADIEFK